MKVISSFYLNSQFFERRAHALLVEPDGTPDDFPFRIYDVIRGVCHNAIGVEKFFGSFHCGEGELTLFPVVSNRFVIVPVIDSNHSEFRGFSFVIDFLNVRQLLTASPSVIKPEIDDSGFVLFPDTREFYGFPVCCFESEIRGWLTYRNESCFVIPLERRGRRGREE